MSGSDGTPGSEPSEGISGARQVGGAGRDRIADRASAIALAPAARCRHRPPARPTPAGPASRTEERSGHRCTTGLRRHRPRRSLPAPSQALARGADGAGPRDGRGGRRRRDATNPTGPLCYRLGNVRKPRALRPAPGATGSSARWSRPARRLGLRLQVGSVTRPDCPSSPRRRGGCPPARVRRHGSDASARPACSPLRNEPHRHHPARCCAHRMRTLPDGQVGQRRRHGPHGTGLRRRRISRPRGLPSAHAAGRLQRRAQRPAGGRRLGAAAGTAGSVCALDAGPPALRRQPAAEVAASVELPGWAVATSESEVPAGSQGLSGRPWRARSSAAWRWRLVRGPSEREVGPLGLAMRAGPASRCRRGDGRGPRRRPARRVRWSRAARPGTAPAPSLFGESGAGRAGTAGAGAAVGSCAPPTEPRLAGAEGGSALAVAAGRGPARPRGR